jgi:hypothetical protein
MDPGAVARALYPTDKKEQCSENCEHRVNSDFCIKLYASSGNRPFEAAKEGQVKCVKCLIKPYN